MDSIAVKQQLRQLQDSRQFSVSERLLRLLSHLVKKTLTGQIKDLNQRQIAEDVFNKGEAFDPEKDSIVRVEISKLRNALRHYYLEFGNHDPICIQIPTRTYIPTFTKQAQFPCHEKNVEPKILILPIESLEQDDIHNKFGRYLSEELLLTFSNTPGIRVTPPSSWDDVSKQKEIRDIPYIMEGIYYHCGNDSKLNIRIQDTEQDEITWAKSYQLRKNESELLSTLSTLAHRIVSDSFDPYVGKVVHKISCQEISAPSNALQARTAKLKYFRYLNNLSNENYYIARQHLDQAVKLSTDDYELACMQADMIRAGYAQGINQHKNPIKQVLKKISQLVNVMPHCLSCKISYCYALLQARKKNELFHIVDDILSTPHLPPTFGAEAAITLMLGGEWDKGRIVLEQMNAQIIHHPEFFIYPLILDAYRKKDFEQALSLCHQYCSDNFFWRTMLQCASLAQMGESDKAISVGKTLLIIRPELIQHLHRTLTCFILDDQLIEFLEDGLRKAGIPLLEQESEQGKQN